MRKRCKLASGVLTRCLGAYHRYDLYDRMLSVKVTVCELNNEPEDFARDWKQLVDHVEASKSDLVLLPEKPFYSWFACTHRFDPAVWQAALVVHDNLDIRLRELAPAIVLGTRPVVVDSRRFNQGFVWESESRYRAAHLKYYLPEEEGFWEASWYDRGDGDFRTIQSSRARIGLWNTPELTVKRALT